MQGEKLQKHSSSLLRIIETKVLNDRSVQCDENLSQSISNKLSSY